jgi:hypothetical protein
MEAVRYLIAEHLLIWSGTRTIRLTHEGRREMEATLRAPNDPTEHFPVPAIQQLIQHFHGAVGVGAQTGGTSNVEQHIGSSSQEVLQLLAEIRAAIPETATDMLEAANDLQEEISKKTPKPSRLKAFVALLWAGATHIVEIAPKVLDLCDRLKLPRPPMPG